MLTKATIEQYIADHKACADDAYVHCITHMNDADTTDYLLYNEIYKTHETLVRDYQRLLERLQ